MMSPEQLELLLKTLVANYSKEDWRYVLISLYKFCGEPKEMLEAMKDIIREYKNESNST